MEWAMNPSQIKARIESLAPGTQAEVVDLTGTQDHYQATIVSPAFKGRMTMEQHRMILDLFKAEVISGEVHALSMKTFTPEQYQTR